MSHDFCPDCHKDAADALREYNEAMSIGPLENTLRISDGSAAVRYSSNEYDDVYDQFKVPDGSKKLDDIIGWPQVPRYSQYPGHQLFKSVEFVIGGQVVDYHGTCDCKCGCRVKFQLFGGWNEGERPSAVNKCDDCNWRCKLLNKTDNKK